MNASRAHRLLLRAEVDDGASTTVTHTVEVSTAHARIQFDRPLAVGARVGLVLSLPKLLRPVRAEGTIEAHEAPTAPGAFGGFRAALSFGSDGDRAAIASLLARSEAAAAGRGAPLRGLIVDDSLIVREIFSYTFRRRTRIGAASQVDVAADAEQATEWLAAATYDFAIVDQLLPGKSGAELVAAIRADARHAAIPIVGMSTAGAEARDALLAAGADLYLNKPMEVLDLCTTLQTLTVREEAAAAVRARRKILVVDDSPMMLELVHDALETAGFQAFTTSDLGEMGRLIEAERPDLILLDVQMPEAYGDDVANVLRGLRHVTVPVLLFSIMDEAELADRAKAAAVDGYISKGAGLVEMVRRVKALLDDGRS